MNGEHKHGFSILELITRVDSWPYYQEDPEAYKAHMQDYYYFVIEGFHKPFGYVHSSTISREFWEAHWNIDEKCRLLTLQGSNNFAGRTSRMKQTLRSNTGADASSPFGEWCDELFPVYDAQGRHVLDMNGAGVDAFGIVSYACHMIAYIRTTGDTKYWVPRRAKTKLSYPNMFDNTVGGSLVSGESPIDCIVRECEEEASVAPEYTRTNITACSTLLHSMTQTDHGQPGCQHEVHYLYEMELPKGILPMPNDGEVHEFRLLSLGKVITALRNGDFKLNCATTWVAFLIRHGYINAENEPDLVEISARLPRKHDLFMV